MPSQSFSDLQFSHIGLYVTDLQRQARFYKRALLFTQTDTGFLGPVELIFLSRNPNEHHQLVLATGRPSAGGFSPINQISLRVPDLTALRRYRDRLLAEGAANMSTVTHGNAVSIYCVDPEGNRLELFMDTPWYCEQPLREPINIDQSDEAVLAQVEALARTRPRFMPREQWRSEVEREMQLNQNQLSV
jgi:catechol-2,3-dioxygenase